MKQVAFILAVLWVSITVQAAAPTTQPAYAVLTPVQVAALPDLVPQIRSLKSGKTLIVTKGTYRLSVGVDMEASGTTIEFNGSTVYCQPTTGGASNFHLGASHIVIKNGTIVGGGNRMFYVRGPLASIHNNAIVGSVTTAVQTDLGGTSCNFANNSVCVTQSVSAYWTQSRGTFTDNELLGSLGEYDLRTDLDINGKKLDGLTVSGNVFTSSAPFGKAAVGFRMGDNILFLNNVITGSNVIAAQSPTPNTITSPKFCNAGLTITGNTFNNTPAGFNSVSIRSGATVIATGNTFVLTPGPPFAIDQPSLLTLQGNCQVHHVNTEPPRLVSAGITGKVIDEGGETTKAIP
jgi:hypothetical protein